MVLVRKTLLFIVLFSDCAFAQSVTLTWVQSSSPNVTANNVYRSPTATGTYTLVYSSSTPITQWVDTTVGYGEHVCYKVTALVSTEESAKSNYACKTVAVAAPTDEKAQ